MAQISLSFSCTFGVAILSLLQGTEVSLCVGGSCLAPPPGKDELTYYL